MLDDRQIAGLRAQIASVDTQTDRLTWEDEFADEFVVSHIDQIYELFDQQAAGASDWARHSPMRRWTSNNLVTLTGREAVTLRVLSAGFARRTGDVDEQVTPLIKKQLSLSLGGVFSPSKELVQIWVRGLQALAAEAAGSSTDSVPAASQIEAQQEFAKQLISLFGSIGQQLRYEGATNPAVTNGERFALRYQIAICDRFFVIPDEAAGFLRLLRSELIVALSNGCRIEGGWGRLTVDSSNNIHYSITAPNFLRDSSFVASDEVE